MKDSGYEQQIELVTGVCLVVTLATVSLAKDKQDDAKDREQATKCLGMAKLSAVEAIQTAMKKVPNGKAVQIGLHMGMTGPCSWSKSWTRTASIWS